MANEKTDQKPTDKPTVGTGDQVAPAAQAANPWLAHFDEFVFSFPTASSKPFKYADGTIQHRLVQATLRVRGTGAYQEGFSVVALETPGDESVIIEGRGPTRQTGPKVYKPIYDVKRSQESLASWQAFMSILAEKGEKWYVANKTASGNNAAPVNPNAKTVNAKALPGLQLGLKVADRKTGGETEKKGE